MLGEEDGMARNDCSYHSLFFRQTERAGKRQGGEEDYDEGVEEQLEDEDDEDVYILSKVKLKSYDFYCLKHDQDV